MLRGEVAYLFKSLVNHIRVLEVIICKEVELVEEVSDINTAERIHLRKWQDRGKDKFFSRLRRKPADICNFIVLIKITDWHWHVVIRGDNLVRLAFERED